MKTFDEAAELIRAGSNEQVSEIAARYDAIRKEVFLHPSVTRLAAGLLKDKIDMDATPRDLLVEIMYAMVAMLYTGVVIGIEMEKVETGGVVAG